MNFTVDPCKAIQIKQQDNIGINEINDLCYSICDAYGNPIGCSDKCKEIIAQKQFKLGRWSKCYYTRPTKPVNWIQIPRYFPQYLKNTKND